MVSVWCKVVLSFSLQREGEECWGLVLIRPYMQSLFFDCRGRTKCHGKNSPRISAFPFKYNKNKEMPRVQAANARTHSGKMPTTHGRIDVFLSHITFSLTSGSLTFKGHFPLSCCFVELWSHCYSHMYKYDTVFPWRIAWAIIIFFARIRGRLYTMKHFFVEFWCKRVTIKDFSTTSFLKKVIDKLLTISGCNNRYNGIWTSEIKGAVSWNLAKLGNNKMPVKLRET